MFNLLHKYEKLGPGEAGSVNSGGTGAAEAGKGTVNHAQVDKTDVKVDGNGNVGLGFNSNHILQFPRQPKKDDGKWVAMGSLLGALLGKLASAGIMKKVKAAESKWKEVNDALYNQGKDLWGKAPGEWGKLLAVESEVEADADWNKSQRDAEIDYAYRLNTCNDEIHNKLCQLVNCGYKPDYYGISTRVVAAAEAAAEKEYREMKKSLNRYAAKGCCDIGIRLATAKVMSVVGTVSKLREDERKKMWDVNTKLMFDGADMFERHRQGRINDASSFEKEHNTQLKWLYDKRNYNYFKLVELGGEFLASAGKNYGWLADSMRKSAEKDAAGLSSLGAMIALVVGMFWCGNPLNACKDDTCGG